MEGPEQEIADIFKCLGIKTTKSQIAKKFVHFYLSNKKEFLEDLEKAAIFVDAKQKTFESNLEWITKTFPSILGDYNLGDFEIKVTQSRSKYVETVTESNNRSIQFSQLLLENPNTTHNHLITALAEGMANIMTPPETSKSGREIKKTKKWHEISENLVSELKHVYIDFDTVVLGDYYGEYKKPGAKYAGFCRECNRISKYYYHKPTRGAKCESGKLVHKGKPVYLTILDFENGIVFLSEAENREFVESRKKLTKKGKFGTIKGSSEFKSILDDVRKEFPKEEHLHEHSAKYTPTKEDVLLQDVVSDISNIGHIDVYSRGIYDLYVYCKKLISTMEDVPDEIHDFVLAIDENKNESSTINPEHYVLEEVEKQKRLVPINKDITVIKPANSLELKKEFQE